MLIFSVIEAKNLSIRRGGLFNFLTRVPILHRGKVPEKKVFELHTIFFRIMTILCTGQKKNQRFTKLNFRVASDVNLLKSNL